MKEFDKVIGYSSVKQELELISDTLKNRDAYNKLGVTAPVALLLHGEPGVGKTLMANCLIAASGLKAFVCRKDKPNGDFVKFIKETFDKAAEAAPSIVLLDDMDKFCNSDPRCPDSEEYVTVQSCIDEVRGKGVFTLATANRINALPRSLMRAGRFRAIEVDTPQGQDAVKIIAHYIKDKNFADDVSPRTIARIMSGRSCAELETVINEAGILAGFERKDKITMDHFMEACMRTVFNVPPADYDDEDWFSERNEIGVLRDKVIYHEAGHAVISELLAPESVTLVSAHNRAGSSGGFTSYYHDGSIEPMEWKKTRIVASLGGAAATEQKYGQSDSGASRDIGQAFDMLYDLITDNCICGFSLHEWCHRDSEEIISGRERAATTEMEKYFRKAKEILALNAQFFEKVACALKEKLILTTEDIQRIKAECTLVPVSL